MLKKYLTESAAGTKKLGEKLAREILKKKASETAFIIGLEGELGGGKTTFLQGFAKGLGIKEKILSPTFVILKRFSAQGGPASGWKYFYHLDCYRINKPKEILDLGFKEIISNSRNIVAIEWAERIKKILPKNTLIIRFRFIDEKKRKICIERLTNL
jgi:tRNA threonylcarbamoyladenosine biosynthesis protein TsaE